MPYDTWDISMVAHLAFYNVMNILYVLNSCFHFPKKYLKKIVVLYVSETNPIVHAELSVYANCFCKSFSTLYDNEH